MQRHPGVSVIVPVYNAQAYIAEAAESILRQSHTDFELLIINDGSTDRSGELLRSLAQRDPRIRLIEQENRGLLATLNRAIGEAAGEYLARMDADDVSLPNRLAKQVAFLDAHPAVGVVGGAYQAFDGDWEDKQPTRYPLTDADIRAAMSQELYNPFAHPAVMMRKSAVQAAGGYRRLFVHAEDYDLWLRMAERGEMANLADVVLRYRVHVSQRTFESVRILIMCMIAAYESAQIRQRSGKDPLDGVAVVDDELMSRLNVSSERVDRLAAEMLLGQGYRRADMGQFPQAMSTFGLLMGQIRSPDVKREYSHRVNAARARVSWRQHQAGRATIYGVQALLQRTRHVIARKLSGPISPANP